MIDMPAAAVYYCCLQGGAAIVYPWIFSAGVLLSIAWLMLQDASRESTETVQDLLPAAAWSLGLGLLLARLCFVGAYAAYYFEHPVEILWLWQGGLNGAGGAVGAVLGAGIYALVSDLPLRAILDRLAIPGLIVAIGCWMGCWLDGCAYGIPVRASLPLFNTYDMFATRSSRWPAALIGLIPLLGGLALLNFTTACRMPSGRLAAISFTAVALSILRASLARADPVPIVFHMRADTLAGLALSIAGASAFLISFQKG
ncbi:MAG: prolipoprotein diacylglyceryl transferase [Anaerolineales bacterium]